jgi:hypothetical protein
MIVILLLVLILGAILLGPGAILALIGATFWSIAGGIGITVSISVQGRCKNVRGLGWIVIGALSGAGLFLWYSAVYILGLPWCWVWTLAAAIGACVNLALVEPYLMSALSNMNDFCGRRLLA